MNLLTALERLEQRLPAILRDSGEWSGKDMRFQNPEGFLRVVRLEGKWPKPNDEVRDVLPPHVKDDEDPIIRLHRFFPTKEGEEIMHHHRWPGAMRILKGRYRLGFGWSAQEAGWPGPPREIGIDLCAPSAYAMEHVDVWHSLRIIEETWTVVLGLPNWPQRNRRNPPNKYTWTQMERDEIEEMLRVYREWYP